MSMTVAQIFAINPTTVLADTDLYYLVQSPYTPGTDAAITGASLKAAFGASGTINPGLINQLGYYAASGSALSGLATLANGTLITSAGGAPSISQTLPSAVQGNITTLGTITSGIWHGTIISPIFGGTGINNGASTITIGGAFALAGAFAFTGTLTSATNVTFPTSGTLATTSQLPSLPLSPANGGTGVSNTGNLTWGAAVTFSGAFASTFTLTGVTGVTFPTTGTLATLAGIETFTNKTILSPKIDVISDINGSTSLTINATPSAVNSIAVVNTPTGIDPSFVSVGADTNIGFQIGTKGTGKITLDSQNATSPLTINSGTGLQHATNFLFANTSATQNVTFPDASGTVAFTSSIPSFPLSLSNGGTNASLTASNGGIVYSNATTLAILSGIATGGNMLQSGASGAPAWSVSTWPSAIAINSMLYANSTNTMSALAPVNSAVLTSNSSGVPVWVVATGTGSPVLATSPTMVTPTLGVAAATSINFGGTALANYVEGTYTPVITFSGGVGNVVPTYTTNVGIYTRIGNNVHCIINLTGNGGTAGAGTGFILISLPIAASASNQGGIAENGNYGNGTTVEIVGVSITAGTTLFIFPWTSILTGFSSALTGASQNNTTRNIYLDFWYFV